MALSVLAVRPHPEGTPGVRPELSLLLGRPTRRHGGRQRRDSGTADAFFKNIYGGSDRKVSVFFVEGPGWDLLCFKTVTSGCSCAEWHCRSSVRRNNT